MSAIVSTRGNEDCHAILRGGKAPNYDAASVDAACKELAGAGVMAKVMVDFSHANSRKQHRLQIGTEHGFHCQLPAGFDAQAFGQARPLVQVLLAQPLGGALAGVQCGLLQGLQRGDAAIQALQFALRLLLGLGGALQLAAQLLQTLGLLLFAGVQVLEQPSLTPHLVPGYRFAGKTGTADFPTNLGYTSGKTFASITAFGPMPNPRFSILIRLDAPEAIYGGVVAAPVLKRVIQDLVAYYRIPPSSPTPTVVPRPSPRP